nr:hypothetical protein [Tanacetum cinerariifolium]
MDQQYLTVAKIPVLDTRKFKQWQFWIQQYLQHEHYALWEVIEFEDSKYKTARELWAAILKTFGGNEATKKMKKNLLKQQYGNFKAEGSKTLEQTFNRLQVIVGQLQFMDVEIEQDNLNQKFLTSLAPEWLMHTIVWRNRSDLDTMSLDDLYNHLKKLETLKQEKEGVDGKLAGLLTASKDLDNLIESQRSDKNKEGLGYTVVPPPLAQLYLSPKKDLSWTGLLECANDTVTDYSRPSPTVESTSKDDQNKNSSVSENVASPITPKPFIKFVKPKDSQSESKTDKKETPKKPPVKYVEQYKKPNKKHQVRGNQRNWNNLKSHQLGLDFVLKKKACFNCGDFNHLAYECRKRVKKNFTPRPVAHRPYRPSQRPVKTNMNRARPNRTTLNKQAHSYANRPIHRTSTVRLPYRAPWVPTVNRNYPPVNRKFFTGSRNFPTVNRKFPTANRKFPTGSIKSSTTDMGMKGKPGSSQIKIDDKGYWDSGCSRHMTGGCKITGKGTIKTGKLEFENVYFVKDLKYNLFSMSQICDNKNIVLFTDSKCIALGRDFKLLNDANILLRTPRQHNMYSINLKNIIPHKDLTCLVAKASANECMLWHRRLGYLNFKTMNKLVRHNLVRGLPTKCFKNDHTCTACLKGKQHIASCKSKLVNYVTKPLHTLHMDLFGPTSVSSISHKWYCLVVTDDFSRFTWIFFLKSKDETCGILKKFITEIKNLKNLKVKIIRCDNGGEFRNKEMNDFCSQKEIKREFSNARTPQQNGVAERRNKTLIEAARTMLADAKLPVTFWAEAVNIACYVQNRVIVNKSHNKTPYELFNGKFEEKGDEGYFIGYSMSSKAFRVQFLLTFQVQRIQKVKNKPQDHCNTKVPEGSGNTNPTASTPNPPADHMETLIVETLIPTVSSPVPTAYYTDSQEPSSDARLISKRVANQEETPSLDNILSLTNRFEDILGGTTNSDESNGEEADISNMEIAIIASPTPTLRIHKSHPKSQIIGPMDTPIQTKNKSKEVGELSFIAKIHQKTDPALLQFCLFSCFLSQVEPKKIYDALQEPSWVEAMQEELLQLKIQNVWTLVDCPKGVRPIGTKWVLKNKKDEKGIVIKNKARLVAQGHTQGERIGYNEVFAPVARIEAIRLFLAYALFMGFTVYQMDVKSAFLYGTIDEEVYMIQPPGFQDPKFPAKVYKVEKSYTFFIRRQRENFILVQVYVDDIIFGSSNPRLCREFEALMHEKFQMSAMVKRIFRYLKGHPKLGLWYPKESPFDLVAYSDSDYGGATQDRKSTTGGCQFLGRRLISWQFKKQTIMATSTTEAEYVAAASCCGQVLDCFEKKLISVDHIYTDENVADLLTKPFDAGRFHYLVVEHAMRGFIKGNIIIYTSFVSHIDLGWVIGTSKYWGVLRILMISLTLIPLKGEHNVDFHPMVDFIEASPLRIETTEEGTKILATVDGIIRTVSESSLRKNLKLRDEEGINSLPDAELFENRILMGYNISPNQNPKSTGFNEFSRNIATALGEGSGTPTEPHHTPSPEAPSPSHTTHTSPSLPPVTTTSIPTVTPTETTPIRQYTRRARIAQSSALLTVADEPVSPQRDVSQGEACPTDSGFIADQDRATIAKSFTLPHDSASRVTSPAAVEGSMQQSIPELTTLCTSLQRKLSELTDKFQAHEVEINRLKERVKLLEEREGLAAKSSGDDAPIKGKSMDEGEVTTERISDDSEEMETVLTLMDAATVLASGVINVPTGSGSIPTASTPAEGSVPTGNEEVPTASPVFATATVVTPVTRRKGKEVMMESETPKKQKVQEQIDAHVARELEGQLEREDQRRVEQIARDAEIARIHAEEELQIMISEITQCVNTLEDPNLSFQQEQDMDQQYPTVAKIPMLDIGKFEQWQFWIQQYLQHEHYALWEVIEFGDSYEVPENNPSTTTISTTSGEKSRRTVTLTTEDMLKKKNDTFTRLQVIVGQLQFMGVEVEQDDLNQKFLTSLAPEWLMHTIVWRNRSDLDTMSLDNLYNHLKVYEAEVHKKSEPNNQNMAFISSTKHSRGNDKVNTASIYTASSNVPTASVNVATASISQKTACAYIASQSGRKELDSLKQEKEVVDEKLAGLLTALKDLDNLIESQRSDKSKEGLGYTAVPPPTAQLYLSPKKDLYWTGLPECADDTVTDYSRPSPTVESSSEEDKNRNPSPSKNVASPITPKQFVKFVKASDSPDFVMKKKACFNYGDFNHLTYECRKRVKRKTTRTSFNKSAHSYPNRHFQRKSAVISQNRAPWVPTVNRNFPPVNRKFSTDSRNFPTANMKFFTTSRKFPTGSTKGATADMGMKGKVVKPSACNISYLSDFEPFDGGYVSFGQGGCKITGKGTIKTECIVLERDFKLLDDANILLRTLR